MKSVGLWATKTFMCPKNVIHEKKHLFCEQNKHFVEKFWDKDMAVLLELQFNSPQERLDGKRF